jgi:hypothetical protein
VDPAAEFRRAVEHHQAGRLDEAERAYRAICAEAVFAPVLLNLAQLLEDTGRSAEAGEVLAQAVAAAPGNALAQFRLGRRLRGMRDLAGAETALRRAMALDPQLPDVALQLGATLLAQGRFGEAWPLYDQRRARQELLAKRLGFPEWRGEPLAGKRLLVWREQGFGDQILAARFLPALAEAEVTYAGPPALQRLFARLPLTYAPVAPEGSAVQPHDHWTLPLSIPGRLGVAGPSDLPAPPYLSGQPGGARRHRRRLARRAQESQRPLPFAARGAGPPAPGAAGGRQPRSGRQRRDRFPGHCRPDGRARPGDQRGYGRGPSGRRPGAAAVGAAGGPGARLALAARRPAGMVPAGAPVLAALARRLGPGGRPGLRRRGYCSSSSSAAKRAAWSSAIRGLITSSRASPSMTLGRL